MHYASVRVSRWVWLFLACAGVQAAQTLLHREVVPYAGTLATAALLGYAADRDGTRRVALGGLASLTLAAGVVDGNHGGYGWPLEFGATEGPLPALFVSVAALLLAVAVLERTAVRRPLLIPAAVLALVTIGLVVAHAAAEPERQVLVVAVFFLPVLALVLLLFATNAALAGGRRWRAAGVGLLPVLVLALGALSVAGSIEVRPPDAERYAIYQEARLYSEGDLRALAEARVNERVAIAVLAAPAPDRAESVAPVTWSLGDWEGDPDWSTLLPATAAALLLLGLAAYVRAVF